MNTREALSDLERCVRETYPSFPVKMQEEGFSTDVRFANLSGYIEVGIRNELLQLSTHFGLVSEKSNLDYAGYLAIGQLVKAQDPGAETEAVFVDYEDCRLFIKTRSFERQSVLNFFSATKNVCEEYATYLKRLDELKL